MSKAPESLEQAKVRWDRLKLVQEAYPTFRPFLVDMMDELGFDLSELQEDIGDYLETGPLYRMIQAQRGQAKTTITAIYAVWRLLHSPWLRILILSAGETRAKEISTLIISLIKSVDILEPLRPDTSYGDRSSVEAFDCHHSLKGTDKSPSVACIGVMGNLQGARADVLIADDVESGKNSRTANMRALLLDITRDFTSINSEGDIIYLGTPQSVDSIYNTLISRGFDIRIWPGRYPTEKQLPLFGQSLAPYILNKMLADPSLQTGGGVDGKSGKATDNRLNEEVLVKKELDQGTSYFYLQHMLLTAMMDAMRFPLKTANLVSLRVSGDLVPLKVVRGFGAMQTQVVEVGAKKYVLSLPHEISQETRPLTSTCFYIDPAAGGENADETGWVFGGLLNSTVYWKAVGGVPGGYELDKMVKLANAALDFRPTLVKIEKNMGFGAFAAVFAPVLKKQSEMRNLPCPPIEEELVTGQKELRIVEALEPVMGRGSLVVDETIAEQDAMSIAHYPAAVRDTYSVLYQLSRLTRDRKSLIHDDRLDALSGLVRHFTPALIVEQDTAVKAAQEAELKAWMANPTGLPRSVLQSTQRQLGYRSRFQRRA